MIDRLTIGRITYGCYLIILFIKFKDGVLLSQQLVEPVFQNPKLNITHWFFLSSGLKEIVFSSYFFRVSIDLLLFGLAIICLINPRKVVYCVLFAILIWFYQFLYNSVITHFAIGFLFSCIPFIFRDDIKFSIVFNFGRYFLCGLYFLAGCFKIYNKGVFNLIQMQESIRMSVFDFLYHNQTGFRTQLMKFLLSSPSISYTLFLLATLLELFFLIGFFTKKYDILLVYLFLTFHIINYLILDLTFLNHFIILIFFLPMNVRKNATLIRS